MLKRSFKLRIHSWTSAKERRAYPRDIPVHWLYKSQDFAGNISGALRSQRRQRPNNPNSRILSFRMTPLALSANLGSSQAQIAQMKRWRFSMQAEDFSATSIMHHSLTLHGFPAELIGLSFIFINSILQLAYFIFAKISSWASNRFPCLFSACPKSGLTLYFTRSKLQERDVAYEALKRHWRWGKPALLSLLRLCRQNSWPLDLDPVQGVIDFSGCQHRGGDFVWSLGNDLCDLDHVFAGGNWNILWPGLCCQWELIWVSEGQSDFH